MPIDKTESGAVRQCDQRGVLIILLHRIRYAVFITDRFGGQGVARLRNDTVYHAFAMLNTGRQRDGFQIAIVAGQRQLRVHPQPDKQHALPGNPPAAAAKQVAESVGTN